jgi:hypothetical protein
LPLLFEVVFIDCLHAESTPEATNYGLIRKLRIMPMSSCSRMWQW